MQVFLAPARGAVAEGAGLHGVAAVQAQAGVDAVMVGGIAGRRLGGADCDMAESRSGTRQLFENIINQAARPLNAVRSFPGALPAPLDGLGRHHAIGHGRHHAGMHAVRHLANGVDVGTLVSAVAKSVRM